MSPWKKNWPTSKTPKDNKEKIDIIFSILRRKDNLAIIRMKSKATKKPSQYPLVKEKKRTARNNKIMDNRAKNNSLFLGGDDLKESSWVMIITKRKGVKTTTLLITLSLTPPAAIATLMGLPHK